MIRKLGAYIFRIVITTVIVFGGYIFMNGMFLIGIPKAENLQAVKIEYFEPNHEIKEITGSSKLELAVKITGFLNYSVFEKAEEPFEPKVTITYLLNDRTEISVAADNNAVLWKGKLHKIKQPDIFINISETIFD